MTSKVFALAIAAAMLFAAAASSGPATAADPDSNSFELSVKRFSGGIRIPTVSSLPYEDIDFSQFVKFRQYLKESYPRVFQTMEPTLVNDHALLLRWKGRDASKLPKLFLSHYDVVPVSGYDWKEELKNEQPVVFRFDDTPLPAPDAIQNAWSYPPFSGAVADGRIYGRGSLDMKGMLFSLLEAADALLAEGFVPEQDIWFAFGQDEEISGIHGARKIAPYFKEKGLRFAAVFDEGGFILEGGAILESLKKPIAVVGMGEKGFATVRIKVRGMGGHSSIPPVHPTKGSLVLASEIVKIIDENPMPAKMIPVVASFIDEVSEGKTSLAEKDPDSAEVRAYLDRMAKVSISNAMIRTTSAVTMMHGSDGANVLAAVAEIMVNFRILPGDTVADVKKHVETLCEGYDVEIDFYGDAREPSALTSPDSPVMKNIREAVKKGYPDAIVAPYLTVGATDAYKYQDVSDNIFRLIPALMNQAEIRTVHNDNEFLSMENYRQMIAYFRELMITAM